jgi:SagB-type dehydrogenase family enzyme
MGVFSMKKIGKEFIEFTKDQYDVESDQMKGVPQPPLELPRDISAELIVLPKFNKESFKDISLFDAVIHRQSIRKYSEQALNLEELSVLLWCTQGVKQIINTRATRRTVPSAGARHAFETYLLINKVDSLKSGLYRYMALEHSLAEVKFDEDIADKITAACMGQGFVKTSAVTFIWTAVTERMTWRYNERGYRYLHLDAGHVCQNLYLAAEALECGCCAIAAYNDDELNEIIGIDSDKQFAIYIATVGKR